MRIAIVGGTAGLGFGFAVRLAKAGEEVVIGSRDAGRATDAAERAHQIAGGEVTGAENPKAVTGADVVIVAVPFPGQAATYATIKDHLTEGITVIDCTAPLASDVGGKATRVLGVWEGSAAQQAKGILGSAVHVGSGFHTVQAAVLENLSQALDMDVLVCGDKVAREAAKTLLERLPGARFIDCGPLETARILEYLPALIIGINVRYHLEEGVSLRMVGLPE